MIETVFNRKNEEEKLTTPYPYKMEEKDTLAITVEGQTPDRCIDDRSVFISMKTDIDSDKSCSSSEINARFWLDGEQAIELGEMLIRHGRFALEANRVYMQNIIMEQQLLGFIKSHKVKTLTFERIDTILCNYGKGFELFKITPIWKTPQCAPKYQEDFCYETVIYFSNFIEEYNEQLNKYQLDGKCKIEFVNYDHNKRIKEFYKECENLK